MNPEQKLIKTLKESKVPLENVVGNILERISDLENEVSETTKDNLKNLEHIVKLSSEIVDTNDAVIKINNRLEKVEELTTLTNKLVRLQKQLEEKQ